MASPCKRQKTQFVCDNCNLVFDRLKSLTYHLPQCLATKGDIMSSFNCPYCNKSFLKCHLSVYTKHLNENHFGLPYIFQNDLLSKGKFDSFSVVEPNDFYSSPHEDFIHDTSSGLNPLKEKSNRSFLTINNLYKATRLMDCDLIDNESVDTQKIQNLSVNKCSLMLNDFLDQHLDWTIEQQDFNNSTTNEEQFVVEEIVEVDNYAEAVAESIGLLPSGFVNERNGDDQGFLELQQNLNHKQLMAINDNQQTLCQVNLLNLLDKNNAPLHLFDDIMKWMRSSVIMNNYAVQTQAPLRKTLIRNIIEENNLQLLFPKIIKFVLPNAKQSVKVITHNVRSSLFSLLSDKDLMKPENLIFKDNPLENPNNNSNQYLSDVNDGYCYREAYTQYCPDSTTDVLCPLILFIDKTHTDAKGNQTLEPVCVTLGIFNQQTRNREEAWRIIGFIPSSANIANKQLSSDEKQSDYHSMLNVVLSPLAQLQSFKGLAWKIQYNEMMYDVSLKIPILFICGDSEGQDKLVGRRLQYHNLVAGRHICRYCNVPYEKSDDPFFSGSHTKSNTIKKYIAKSNKKKLTEIGYLKLDENALHELTFCDTVHGINGSVPADLLHTYQLGILIYVVDGLFAQKKASTIAVKNKKRAIQEAESSDDETQGQNLQGSDKSSHNIFNNKQRDMFDQQARIYGKLYTHQADRDLPRTHFPGGITGEKKKNGNEMQGVILNILTIFLSHEFEQYRALFGYGQIGATRIGNWILLLERLLMVEEFLKQTVLKRQDVKRFGKWLPNFLKFLKKVVDRQTAASFKLLKFHLCTHLANDILKWGTPGAYNSATGESNHKMLKRRARKTQRQCDVIEEQQGVRYVEQLAIQCTVNTMHNKGKIHVNDEGLQAQKESSKLAGYSYFMTKHGIFDSKNASANFPIAWSNRADQMLIFDLLKTKVLPFVDGKQIHFMTTLHVDGNLYRGDPLYKGGSWQDWAYCDWGPRHGCCPIHILIFADLSHLKHQININGIEIPVGEQVAIVHMVEHPLDANENGAFMAHPKSKLFFKASKMISNDDGNPVLAFVDIKSIVNPCIAVPFSLDARIDRVTYLFLKPRTEWTDIFARAVKDARKRQKADRERSRKIK
jgi:hypothetical protein